MKQSVSGADRSCKMRRGPVSSFDLILRGWKSHFSWRGQEHRNHIRRAGIRIRHYVQQPASDRDPVRVRDIVRFPLTPQRYSERHRSNRGAQNIENLREPMPRQILESHVDGPPTPPDVSHMVARDHLLEPASVWTAVRA